MKTAARFDYPEFAHLARTILANHEIEAFVFDENIVQLNWFYSYAVGGVRLVVDAEDHEEAVRIIRCCSRIDMEGDYETISVAAGHLGVLFLYLFTGSGVPCLLFGRKTYYIDPDTRRIYSRAPKG